MSYQRGFVVVAFALMLGLVFPSLTRAGGTLVSKLGWPRHAVAVDDGSVRLKIVPMAPTHRFQTPKEAARGASLGVEVPRYEWGYFGARYRYPRDSHLGYYGDYFQWRFKRH